MLFGKSNYKKDALCMDSDEKSELDEAFVSAATDGYGAITHRLLKAGADIHTRGDAALICAAENGHAEMVDYLLLQGADRHNDKALRKAALNGHRETMKILFAWDEADPPAHMRPPSPAASP